MIKAWADAHGFPGDRATLSLQGATGAGMGETRSTLFRLARAAMGPIHHDDRLVQVDDPPDSGIVAGLIGNEVLSHCSAVVIDIAGRAAWMQGPCDRRSGEALGGWRLARSDDPHLGDRPWIVEQVFPNGSASEAGIEAGDRLLSVGGAPAELDVSKVQAAVSQPAGTQVVVTFERTGQKKQATMVLRQLLSSTGDFSGRGAPRRP
jgi:hypothetical protein